MVELKENECALDKIKHEPKKHLKAKDEEVKGLQVSLQESEERV